MWIWDIIGWADNSDAIVYITVINMVFKLMNAFFFFWIGLVKQICL